MGVINVVYIHINISNINVGISVLKVSMKNTIFPVRYSSNLSTNQFFLPKKKKKVTIYRTYITPLILGEYPFFKISGYLCAFYHIGSFDLYHHRDHNFFPAMIHRELLFETY